MLVKYSTQINMEVVLYQILHYQKTLKNYG